eukprot:scaffold2204_cov166-Amphora_coffeaeformis.AAC.23
MGGIYATVALVLVGWHALLHQTTNNSVTNNAVLSPKTRMSPLPPRPSVANKNSGGNITHMDHNTVLFTRPEKPVTIAYAISLIKVSWKIPRLPRTTMSEHCGDFQSTAAGLIDAAMVLRHSIHETSSRVGKSNYDYKMYVIVEVGAQKCSKVLEDIGFTLLVREPVVKPHEMQDTFLREHIHQAWCCGHKEFIKIHSFSLEEPIVVHVDMDFVMHKPMDTVLDVLLYDKDSDIGREARSKLEVEKTLSPDQHIDLPDRPQAAFTKDWGQIIPGFKPLFQAGFWVARTNPQVTEDIANIIRTEKYVPGLHRANGWGGLGYGAFVGSMAMQGLMAFYYDQKVPGTWIELNTCRYNHMGMDARMNSQPNFMKIHKGKCRNNSTYCEDCMVTPMDKIYNIHYTQCRKPWLCVGEGNEGIPRKVHKRTPEDKIKIPIDNVHVDHCLELANIWHSHRTDLETKLQKLTGDRTIVSGQKGMYMPDWFQGHCSKFGKNGYLTISAKPESLVRVKELYGE